VSGVFNLGDILELVDDGLDNERFAYQQLALEKDESISHVATNRCDQLQSLRVELLKESLGEIATVTNQLTHNDLDFCGTDLRSVVITSLKLKREAGPRLPVNSNSFASSCLLSH